MSAAGQEFTVGFAGSDADLAGVREKMATYLEWDLREFERLSGVSLDLDEYLANSFDHIEDYLPPRGRLAMARRADGTLGGIALMRALDENSCEIKRMFVDPSLRGLGLGRQLLECLLQGAREIRYDAAYLDTVSYMTEAHGLYRSLGFQDIAQYPGGENDDPALADHLIFMRLKLR